MFLKMEPVNPILHSIIFQRSMAQEPLLRIQDEYKDSINLPIYIAQLIPWFSSLHIS